MRLGYVRLTQSSPPEAEYTQQLQQAGCDSIAVTDKDATRGKWWPAFTTIAQNLQKGDTLIVFSIDALGCTLKEIIRTVLWLYEQGIEWRSLHDNIDTQQIGSDRILLIFQALNHCYSTVLKANQRPSSKAGRPRALSSEVVQQFCIQHDQGLCTMKELSESLGISRATGYAYVNQYKEEVRALRQEQSLKASNTATKQSPDKPTEAVRTKVTG